MQNGLILFQSKYGAARRYAGWLAEATGFPLCPAKDVEKSALSGADPVILAGGIYASGVAGIQVLRKNRELLQENAARSWRWGRPPPTRRQLKRCGNST